MLVGFQNLVEDGVLRAGIVPYETRSKLVHPLTSLDLYTHEECEDEQDGGNLADSQNVMLQDLLRKLVTANGDWDSRAF